MMMMALNPLMRAENCTQLAFLTGEDVLKMFLLKKKSELLKQETRLVF